MNWLPLLWCYVVTIAYAFTEIYRDKGIAEISDKDGERSEFENEVIHGYKIPQRGLALLLIIQSTSTFYILINQSEWWLPLFVFIPLCTALLWASINIIAAIWWLKQEWTYVGSTATTDLTFGKPHIFYLPIIIGLTLFYLIWMI